MAQFFAKLPCLDFYIFLLFFLDVPPIAIHGDKIHYAQSARKIMLTTLHIWRLDSKHISTTTSDLVYTEQYLIKTPWLRHEVLRICSFYFLLNSDSQNNVQSDHNLLWDYIKK